MFLLSFKTDMVSRRGYIYFPHDLLLESLSSVKFIRSAAGTVSRREWEFNWSERDLKALNNRYQTCGDTQRKTQMLLSYTVDVSRYYKCKQVIKRVHLWCTHGGWRLSRTGLWFCSMCCNEPHKPSTIPGH